MQNNNNLEQKDHLYCVRHSAEHVLMQAMKQIGYQFFMAMGPATDEGFYFDFELLEGTVSEDDFPEIEAEMKKIIDQNLPITVQGISLDEARKLFKDNPYKQEWINEIEEKGQNATIYWTGEPGKEESFVDLCKGPHVASTKEIVAVKLLSIAGAYWRGSEKNKMLTRIYGTAFETQEELDKYVFMLEEAKKRDHRKLGEKLDLFTFSDMVGPGLVLWKPKGTVIRDQLENWAKETEDKWGYDRVATPHIAKHTLFETSGHLPYYKDDMYSPMEIDGEEYYLKGMNCPHHHMIYNSTPKSYRDLPLRFAEYGTVYRYEQSGSLFGLMRVRAIAQNDAHIYCSLEDAEKEFVDVLKLHEYYYNALGLTRDDYHIVIGLPDEAKRDKYHGDKALWDKAEKIMRSAIEKVGIKSVDEIGGAAFYGPKVDINIKSSIGREFSISTTQLDLYMPTRFNLEFTNQAGEKELAAVIHRAPLGSHERFIGFLIEHFAGSFPVWLSPVQVKLIPISDKHIEYAKKVAESLQNEKIRVEIDDKAETMGNKIRKAQEEKIPYMIILGDKEVEAGNISVRYRDGKQENGTDLAAFTNKVKEIIITKSLNEG
jgi:threonyl-tRNA synthetase